MKILYIDESSAPGSWLLRQGADNIIDVIQNSGELIRAKNGKSVYRVINEEIGLPYLVKTWCVIGFASWLKSQFSAGNSYTEYRNKRYLEQMGVPSPELYFFGIGRSLDQKVLHIQISEFVMTETDAMHYIKELLRKEMYPEVRAFSHRIILLTKALLDANFVDPDHRMGNLMVNELGQPVKIDLEIASVMSRYRSYERKIGSMIGTLIYSYIFAVYPRLDIAQEFSDRIIREIELSKCARKRAKNLIKDALEKQLHETNVDSRINLNF